MHVIINLMYNEVIKELYGGVAVLLKTCVIHIIMSLMNQISMANIRKSGPDH